VGLDLPVAFGDPLRLKGDARGFAHTAYMEVFAPGRQRRNRPYSSHPEEIDEKARRLAGLLQFGLADPPTFAAAGPACRCRASVCPGSAAAGYLAAGCLGSAADSKQASAGSSPDAEYRS